MAGPSKQTYTRGNEFTLVWGSLRLTPRKVKKHIKGRKGIERGRKRERKGKRKTKVKRMRETEW